MNRTQLEHVIAAAADVSGEREIVVIGSQAILGTADEPPASMLLSMEADIYPRNAPEKSIDIDGSLGDGSPFHGSNGYFAHSVGARDALSAGLVQIEELFARTDDLPVSASDREHIREMLAGIDRRLGSRKG